MCKKGGGVSFGLDSHLIHSKPCLACLGVVRALRFFVGAFPSLPTQVRFPAPHTKTGGILGIEGGQEFVTTTTMDLINSYPNTSLVGVWMQDWVGTATFGSGGERLLWNWELNYNQYPDWNSMLQTFQSKGMWPLSLDPCAPNETDTVSSS